MSGQIPIDWVVGQPTNIDLQNDPLLAQNAPVQPGDTLDWSTGNPVDYDVAADPILIEGGLPDSNHEVNVIAGRYNPGNGGKYLRFRFSSWTTDVPALPAQPSTEPHVIGRYSPSKYAFFRLNREEYIPDVKPVILDFTPNFIGRYKPPAYQRFAYNSWDNAPGTPPTTKDNTPNFIGRYVPPQYAKIGYGTRYADVPVIPYTIEGVHNFIARYNPGKIQGFRYNSWDVSASAPPIVAPGNPHFVGKYAVPRLAQFRLNREDFIPDIKPVIAETQPHFIGRYTVAKYPPFQFNAIDNEPLSNVLGIPETQPHFVAKYARQDNPYIALTTNKIALAGNIGFAQPPNTVNPVPAKAMTTLGYPAVPLWQNTARDEWTNRIGDIARAMRQGRQNITLPITLQAGGATATQIIDVRISVNSGVILVPQTADAAVAYAGGIYVSAQNNGSCTISHAANSSTDANFLVIFIG